jgi:hypothetical protein
MPDTLAEIQNRAIREALERNGGCTTWAAEELDNLASSGNLTNEVTIDVADH